MTRGNKGFTLIELMIVIAILVILSFVAIPAIVQYFKGDDETQNVEMVKEPVTPPSDFDDDEEDDK